jgi:PAS domain S-box-containing protein
MGAPNEPLNNVARLRRATRALADIATVDGIVHAVTDRGIVPDASGGVITAIGPDDRLEVLASTFGRPSQAILDDIPLRRSRPLTDAIRTGTPVWLHDEHDFRDRYPEMGPVTSAAWAALPLRVGARIVGALGIGFRSPQTFEENERAYFETLADLCAIVLDRHVLAERRAQNRLDVFVNSNVIGVVSGDSERIREANDAFLQLIGLDREALAAGISFATIAPREWFDANRRAMREMDRGVEVGPYDTELLHAQGHRVPVRIVGTTIGDTEWLALIEDLTAVRAAERELRAREARYRSLVEATNTIVWTTDAEGGFVDVSQTWRAYTGQTETQARGHGWLDAFHEDDRDYLFAALDASRRNRRSWEGQVRLQHATSGLPRRVIVRAVPLVDNGAIVEWVGTVTDIDDRSRTEEVLRATTARLASLMRNAPVGFAFIDDQLRFQLVNDKLAQINGLPPHAHLGRDVREIVPDLAEVNERLLRRVLRGETILDTEVRGATPNAPDEAHDWLINYYPVRDDDEGAILGIGATVVDVTERNQLLAAERDARAEAEASARLSEALSGISATIVNLSEDDAIAHSAGERLVTALGADAAFVARCDVSGHIEDVLSVHGYEPADITMLRSDPDRNSWSTHLMLHRRAPVFYEFPEEFLARFPTREKVVQRLGAHAWAVLPLVAADQTIGFIVVMFRSAHTFTSDERRFLATVSDVTTQAMLRAHSRQAEALARRSAEMLAEAIASERARLAAVLQRMPAGLVVVSAEGARPRVLLSNSRAKDILGASPAGGDADTWLSLRELDGEPMPADATPLHRALHGEEVEPQDALVAAADGSLRRIRTSAVPIRDGEQRITSAVLIIEDVTEQVRRQRDIALLARVGDLVAAPGDIADVLERIVSIAVPSFADACGAYVLDNGALHLYAQADRDPARAARVRELLAKPVPLDADWPIATAARRGRSLLVRQIDAQLPFDVLRPAVRDWVEHVLRPRSLLIVPLRRGDHVTGVLTFTQTDDSDRLFAPEDLDVAIELATRSALLLDRMVAHDETARARDRADRLQRFAAAMARAASVDAVVQAIATEGLEAVEAQAVQVVVRSQGDASHEVLQSPVLPAPGRLVWERVPGTVETELMAALQHERPAYADASVALPLRASDGHAIGALALMFDHLMAFDDEQREFLETVADVVAQSLDRARLYERERDVARALQTALLPSALPDLDGVVTDARYVAGGAGVSVGGDWYDVIRFADGRVGLVIGDAAGRGVEAATLMGKARHAAAALAMDRDSPAAVLARVNEYLHTISSRRTMLTCCYIVLDRDRGVLRYASAGHPPPVVIENDGARFLSGGRGVPLGVVPTAVYEDAEYQLDGSATIVLYTDGLIERRGETIDVGLDRLLDAVAAPGIPIDELCDHLTGKLLTDRGDDDVALLVARVQATAPRSRLDLELPADSRRLQELRTRVTRWLRDAGVAPTVVPDLVIALNEAASNSMLHAYAGAAKRGHVRVSLALSPDAVTALVADEGRWREPALDHDGRGIELMHRLMTDVQVEHEASGTRVRLTRALPISSV